MLTMDSATRSPMLPGLLDRLGIAASAFCLLQCLALPVLIVIAPITSFWLLDHKLFHLILLLLIIPISVTAFLIGYLQHRVSTLWWPAGFGLGLLILASALELTHMLEGLAVALITSAGGVFLISAHWINLRCRARQLLQNTA